MAYNWILSETFSLVPPPIKKCRFWAHWLSLPVHSLTTLGSNSPWLSSAFQRWFNPNPVILLLLDPSLCLYLTLFLSSLALTLLQSFSDFSQQVEVESSNEGRVRIGFDPLQAVSDANGHEERGSPYKLHWILIFCSYSLTIHTEVCVMNSYTLPNIQTHCCSRRQNRFIHPTGNHLPTWGYIVFSVPSLVACCWTKNILLILALFSKSAIHACSAVKS